MTPGATGTVHSINTSRGGVPKRPQPEAAVTADGLAGDRQRNRRYHGGPLRAVSLYSLERIRALQAEGHPADVGTMGENLTIAGLDWDRVRTGVRLAVGPVVLEVTKDAPPCKTIAGSFRDGAFARASQKVRPGWSRFYARVIREGVVRVGDVVALADVAPDDASS
ncbi:MAG: MOSC domain-containing protein [Vicinamibacteria bacterium]